MIYRDYLDESLHWFLQLNVLRLPSSCHKEQFKCQQNICTVINTVNSHLSGRIGWTYEMFKIYGWCPGEKHFKTDQNPLKTKWFIHGLFLNDWFVVFLCKIRGKMGRKWGKITKGSALESGWIWKCSLYSSSPYKIWEKNTIWFDCALLLQHDREKLIFYKKISVFHMT